MRSLFLRLLPRAAFVRKSALVLLMVGATTAAFYWGRLGAPTADAQQVQPRLAPGGQAAPSSDYSRRVVAYIYDNMAITREELGEYLIARFGQERIEFLINRRLIEMACQAKGLYVTDMEVDAQFKEELKDLRGITVQDFTNQILKRFNKSLYEWKEDVIRPKLMLAKLCRPMVEVTQQDLTNAFEARYGPKVQCRIIGFAKGDRQMKDVWTKINNSEEEFADYAKKQFYQDWASKGGAVDPIHKHFGDAKVEAAAFQLKPGQCSQLLEMPDGNWIVIKCDKHLLADTTVSFDKVRLDLHKELMERKLEPKMREIVAELRKQAHPRVLIANQIPQEQLERDVQRNLAQPQRGPAQGMAVPQGAAVPRPTAPAGN